MLSLLPVLPVDLQTPADVFDMLIEALVAKGIDREDVTSIVSAFSNNRSLFSAVHRGPRAI
jgi:hypothetical protein